jgi:iron-regulated transporter 1
MRRIDLFCKLIGPLAIASVDSISSSLAMIVTGSTTVISILVEYFTIARVYDAVPALRARKPLPVTRQRSRNNAWTSCKTYFAKTGRYMRHPAFLPSFSLALLHLTVLSFSGQMITYLIALDVSSGLIGVLRGISALFEICATWIAPKIMTSIGPVRAGIWFLNWEITCLAVACAFFWWDVSPTIVAAGTVSMVVASRIGLWGFDLSAQIIVQDVR